LGSSSVIEHRTGSLWIADALSSSYFRMADQQFRDLSLTRALQRPHSAQRVCTQYKRPALDNELAITFDKLTTPQAWPAPHRSVVRPDWRWR